MIKLCNLTKAYGAQIIFDHVTYTFPDRGLVSILGASGCGKSTLLHLLAGFDSDYEGSIEVFDTTLNEMDAQTQCTYRKNTIGFIFQDFNLLSGYSVLENILLASSLQQKRDAVLLNDKAMQLLTQFAIQDKANEKVDHLSGGEKQRVAIIRALMNEPSIILADEPTGSLDRKNANEIMEVLKQIAKDCLVLLITHDKKICSYADEVLSIEKKQIIGETHIPTSSQRTCSLAMDSSMSKNNLAWKNFKVHWKRFLPVSIGIALGMLAFLLSLSFGNIMESSITEFKEKNTAYNNGYIKADAQLDTTYEVLKADERVENIYYQYILHDVSLQMDQKSETMYEKYPMAKASEQMSYGSMPKPKEKQIAISPSLAKKFDNNIVNLIGKKIQFTYLTTNETLTISGIFNAGYDDFFLSSDLEQTLYENQDHKQAYALTYDVKDFEELVAVHQMLEDKGIHSITMADEVASLQQTFENLLRLFYVISILILFISLFISAVLLVKLQNTRYREIGLLSALGFHKKSITSMLYKESTILAIVSSGFTIVFLLLTYLICSWFHIDIHISMPQYILSICGTILLVYIIALFASYKLVTIDPAKALKK